MFLLGNALCLVGVTMVCSELPMVGNLGGNFEMLGGKGNLHLDLCVWFTTFVSVFVEVFSFIPKVANILLVPKSKE